MDDFKKTIILQATKKSVYHALTNSITKWWTEMFEGSSNEQGETFTISFGTNVFKTLKVEELIPNNKVAWYVTDSLIDIPELKNRTEWINTKIVWEIATQDDKTELRLTHFGLTPQIECYNICEAGWHNFTDSLSEFINTGIGKPFTV
jgi:hypothetical protein